MIFAIIKQPYYEWRVLPFGTTCSPCCATYALQRHVNNHSEDNEEVVKSVIHSFYVDNSRVESPVSAVPGPGQKPHRQAESSPCQRRLRNKTVGVTCQAGCTCVVLLPSCFSLFSLGVSQSRVCLLGSTCLPSDLLQKRGKNTSWHSENKGCFSIASTLAW